MKYWTEERTAEEIMRIANQFDPPRMPSDSEAKYMYGNYGLSNAISKSGGYRYWAQKLNLKQGYSETLVGVTGEDYIEDLLKGLGFAVDRMSAKYPYDLLVDGCVKIDVKTANTSYIKGCPVHAFRLAKPKQTCDVYILYEADTGNVYVVPSHTLHGQVQVEMGLNSKMYQPYKDAFGIISSLSIMFKSL